ncbi:hypothetical protein P170DRAFT_378658 [Aspergillus steynii IBT 23096]|uniref:GRF-type domain-containing protein n=1 Tax=Aspergillus steynii IBT 23096 TaxID=1392250 RepID=A0A2I2GIF0_9EURO|nr:uncharacterized protein P170DRAFT_378658 [Aspergillus steynii IBT 23096]PLB52654.1 hypothetical protein P170DRAFT_378658 [Aspergillus steynii IBT 23096]
MLSPHKSPSKGLSPRTSAPLRGLFADGVWRCDCPGRPPAVKLQTKNHGVNHGKRFYTCQKRPSDQCRFFLWETDAQLREGRAVLSNSRTEPLNPQTPSKPSGYGRGGLLTPQTERPFRAAPAVGSASQAPPQSAKAKMMTEDTDEFEWDDPFAESPERSFGKPRQLDFGSAASSSSTLGDLSPRKAARTDSFTSPGKRKLSDMQNDAPETPTSVWSSRSESWRLPPPSAELCMTPTPSKYRNALSGDPRAGPSDLALEVVKILESHNAVLPRRAQEEVTELLNKHDLKTKGIIRGREISWEQIKKNREEIKRLHERIAVLESQRDLDQKLLNELSKG